MSGNSNNMPNCCHSNHAFVTQMVYACFMWNIKPFYHSFIHNMMQHGQVFSGQMGKGSISWNCRREWCKMPKKGHYFPYEKLSQYSVKVKLCWLHREKIQISSNINNACICSCTMCKMCKDTRQTCLQKTLKNIIQVLDYHFSDNDILYYNRQISAKEIWNLQISVHHMGNSRISVKRMEYLQISVKNLGNLKTSVNYKGNSDVSVKHKVGLLIYFPNKCGYKLPTLRMLIDKINQIIWSNPDNIIMLLQISWANQVTLLLTGQYTLFIISIALLTFNLKHGNKSTSTD